jgi:hypothetical protein
MQQMLIEENSNMNINYLLDADSTLPFTVHEVASRMDDKVRCPPPLPACLSLRRLEMQLGCGWHSQMRPTAGGEQQADSSHH